jgi:hypothetical protein
VVSACLTVRESLTRFLHVLDVVLAEVAVEDVLLSEKTQDASSQKGAELVLLVGARSLEPDHDAHAPAFLVDCRSEQGGVELMGLAAQFSYVHGVNHF